MEICESPVCYKPVIDKGEKHKVLAICVSEWTVVDGLLSINYHLHHYCSKHCLAIVQDRRIM
jgi:hypothetical protein